MHLPLVIALNLFIGLHVLWRLICIDWRSWWFLVLAFISDIRLVKWYWELVLVRFLGWFCIKRCWIGLDMINFVISVVSDSLNRAICWRFIGRRFLWLTLFVSLVTHRDMLEVRRRDWPTFQEVSICRLWFLNRGIRGRFGPSIRRLRPVSRVWRWLSKLRIGVVNLSIHWFGYERLGWLLLEILCLWFWLIVRHRRQGWGRVWLLA